MKPLQPSTPHIVALVGAPGSGKTHFATEFAKMFNAPLLSSRYFEAVTDDTRVIADTTLALIEEFLKTRQTIVVDGATDQRTVRMKIGQLARKHDYKVLLVWVQTDMATAKARWMKTYGNDEVQFERRLKQFSPPHDSESYLVISGRHTFSTQVRTVLKRLSASRPTTAQRSAPSRETIRNRIVVR